MLAHLVWIILINNSNRKTPSSLLSNSVGKKGKVSKFIRIKQWKWLIRSVPKIRKALVPLLNKLKNNQNLMHMISFFPILVKNVPPPSLFIRPSETFGLAPGDKHILHSWTRGTNILCWKRWCWGWYWSEGGCEWSEHSSEQSKHALWRSYNFFGPVGLLNSGIL